MPHIPDKSRACLSLSVPTPRTEKIGVRANNLCGLIGVVKFLGMKCPGKKAHGTWLMEKTRHDRSAPQPDIPNFLTTSG